VALPLDDVGQPVERELHGAECHRGPAAVPVVAQHLDELGARQAGGEPVEVVEHLPHRVDPNGQLRAYVDRGRRRPGGQLDRS
jgi:hypothetical protein